MVLLSHEWSFPNNHQNHFGAKRKFDHHTGVDIFAPEGTSVFSVSDGKVVDVGVFTGPHAVPPMPWWNETFYVMVETESGIVYNYGEISPVVSNGDDIKVGDLLGTVMTVLKKDKGLPMSMLHFEMYVKYPGICAVWNHDQPMPDLLLDPTDFLKSLK